MPKTKKTFPIVIRPKKSEEAIAGVIDTLFGSKEKHRVQQRSILSDGMAVSLAFTHTAADIARIVSENPIVQVEKNGTLEQKPILEDPNLIVSYALERLHDHICNLMVSTNEGRGRKDGVLAMQALLGYQREQQEQLGFWGKIKRKLGMGKKEEYA